MPSSARTALITGATQGIGLAIATELARAGHGLVVHGIVAQDEGDAIAQGLAQAHGVRTTYLRADLAQPAAAAALVERAAAALAPVDILVNNAGIQHTAPVESFPQDRWDAVIALNLTAPFALMKAAVPGMRARGWGRIVNIASVHGLVASVHKTAYLAAKHGLVGMSKGVALETATDGITVNCICPGWTDTPILGPQIRARAEQLGVSLDEATRHLVREKQPNGRLLPPSAIGETAVFLCSAAAAGITGVALPVDGGWTAQ